MMKIEELKQILKGQKPAPHVFLLWGEEAFLRAHYKKQLVAFLSPDVMEDLNVFTFEGKSYNLNQVDEAIEALPVMAEKKLLVFDDSLIFKPDGRTGAKAEYREYWEQRLKDIPPYVYIIFNEKEIDKRSALLKWVDKEEVCVEFSFLGEEEMVRWTVGLFKNLGKQIAPGDARYLNEITPAGMMVVRREAEKLVAYAGDRPQVVRRDIEEMVSPELEGRVFDMVACILRKDASTALRLLDDLFALKTEPNEILGAIVYNADKLLQTKLMAADGADKNQIMSKLKISPFAASKFLRDCTKYSVEQLRVLVKRLAETDGFIKSNSMDNDMLVSLLVSELSTIE